MNSRATSAVKIRLQRYGSKGRPFYRIVAASSSTVVMVNSWNHWSLSISNQELLKRSNSALVDKGYYCIFQEYARATKAKQERVAAKLRKKNEKKKAKASSN